MLLRRDFSGYGCETATRHLGVDPLSADKTELREVAAKLDLSNIADTEEDRDTLLQLLFTVGVELHIGCDKPTFVYHFPATQASLAEISTEDHHVAERFEVYYKGIELANGFSELTDGREQRQRFEQDNRKRAARGLPQHPIDNNLLDALKHGMTECSGVALGVDRLIMIAQPERSAGLPGHTRLNRFPPSLALGSGLSFFPAMPPFLAL